MTETGDAEDLGVAEPVCEEGKTTHKIIGNCYHLYKIDKAEEHMKLDYEDGKPLKAPNGT
jgi:hypothetical protein